MSVKVNLPPGCSGFSCADGTQYKGRAGGTIEVSDRHARAINTGQYGQQGFISATGAMTIGTKRTTECTSPACRHRGQAWQTTCPRCGSEMSELSAGA